MSKGLQKMLSENLYLFLGIVIGLYISSLISDGFDADCHRQQMMKNETAQEIISSSVNKFAPKILTKKPNPSSKKSNEDDETENYDGIERNFSSDEDVKRQKKAKRSYNKRKNPLTCDYCGKTFNRRQHWSSHIRSKHTFEKPYRCNLCDAKYANSHSLLVHKRNHNNEKPFVCSYCGKSFVCSGDLYHHSKIHLNKREYKCLACEKSFNTASILRTHRICMHTDPKDWKYTCSFCSKRFPINSSLVTHLKRHTGVKQFSCHICEKKFFENSELTKHLRSHSSDRPYRCNICETKEYRNRYGLRKHMKIIHDIGSITITKPLISLPNRADNLCINSPKSVALNSTHNNLYWAMVPLCKSLSMLPGSR
ncbi:hypothetical protein NQ315_010919 [Exocentrus adspersus]|uniref:C2H2-type domain-containing protein n=1 Tax=Exocentrus adspersus TaxID=1586481 RepID=A0AAV8VNR2_9CUCU|nr:hypothetical protein NQ315_010919 [Exocentrus adspersus]